MINFDQPGVAIALLALLIGMRLAVYVVESLLKPTTDPVPEPSLSPDDTGEEGYAVTIYGETVTEHSATTPQQHPQRRFGYLYELLDSAIIAVALVFLLIRPFVISAFFIPSGSMIPTLLEGDRVLATKYNYLGDRYPHRGDVVVFRAPKLAVESSGKSYNPKEPIDYVKRVVGLPGDHIRIVESQGVYRNGELLRERYINEIPYYNFPKTPDGRLTMRREVQAQLASHIKGTELVVPDGYIFVLGDNRNSSADGHDWGLLDRDALVGKANFIFWPSERFGPIK